MCGIAGIVRFDGERAGAERVRAMTEVLRHRGPDDGGVAELEKGRVALGHRRLSILDLSVAGAQPMGYQDRFTIVFNGEIYNYLELKEELSAKGHMFRSETDTEVLVAAYAEWGEAALPRLDGMFAFAIHDSVNGSLFLARDRFGEKPLFVRETPGRELVFASEVKALIAAGAPIDADPKMLFHWLAYDAVTDARDPGATFFTGVRRIPPACSIRVDPEGRVTLRRYWEIDLKRRAPDLTLAEASARFRELLETSVARRLRSDVPLGSSLSGGIDSSSIVLLVRELDRGGQPRQTFSARFDDPDLDEGQWIEMVAEKAGVEAHHTWPDAATVAERIERVFYFQEEPFGTAAVVAQHEVMRLAKKHDVTVLLDGQGADEVLGGYLHFFRPLFLELWRRDRERLESERQAYEARHRDSYEIEFDRRFKFEARSPGLLRALGGLRRRFGRPAYLADLDRSFAIAHRSAPPPFIVHRTLRDALYHATTGQGLPSLLRFADRNSMAHSREVRLPFLSHELVEFAFALPDRMKIADGWTKLVLRKAMEDLLPGLLTWRTDKLGFRPPQEKWEADRRVAVPMLEAGEYLRREGILARPRAERGWAYLMAKLLLEFPARVRAELPA